MSDTIPQEQKLLFAITAKQVPDPDAPLVTQPDGSQLQPTMPSPDGAKQLVLLLTEEAWRETKNGQGYQLDLAPYDIPLVVQVGRARNVNSGMQLLRQIAGGDAAEVKNQELNVDVQHTPPLSNVRAPGTRPAPSRSATLQPDTPSQPAAAPAAGPAAEPQMVLPPTITEGGRTVQPMPIWQPTVNPEKR
jgi:DNA polymerase III gamma/tau subunit